MSYYTRKTRAVSFKKDVSVISNSGGLGGGGNGDGDEDVGVVSTHNQSTQTSEPEAEPERTLNVSRQLAAMRSNNYSTNALLRTAVSGNVNVSVGERSKTPTTTTVTTSTLTLTNTANAQQQHDNSSKWEHLTANAESTSELNVSESKTVTPIGRYTNWNSEHAQLASQAWCCIGDLMTFCDRYEFKSLSVNDTRTHANIMAEVTALLNAGRAPFDMRLRFPADIRNPENLWVCVSRCPSVEYHLKRIQSALRKPLSSLSADKRRAAMQNFHLAVNELRLDISARISEVRLYDRNVFERQFQLRWQDA